MFENIGFKDEKKVKTNMNGKLDIKCTEVFNNRGKVHLKIMCWKQLEIDSLQIYLIECRQFLSRLKWKANVNSFSYFPFSVSSARWWSRE